MLVGAAAKSHIWRSILADVFGIPLLQPRNIEECTSMGAAIIGGVATGIYPDFASVRPFFRVLLRQQPVETNAAFYQDRYRVFVRAYEALRRVFPQIAAGSREGTYCEH